MPARAPRIGFVAYAALVAFTLALSTWQRHAVDAYIEKQDYAALGRLMEVVGYLYLAAGVGTVAALLAVARAPRACRAGGLARAAAAVAGLGLVLQIGERVVLKVAGFSHGVDGIDAIVRVAGGAMMLAYCAELTLLLLVVVRVGRAAGKQGPSIAALVGLLVVAGRALVYVVAMMLADRAHPAAALGTVERAAFWATDLAVIALCVWGALLVGRGADEKAPADAPAAGATLGTAWQAPAGGIALYLGAAGARVGCAVLGYVVMAGASGARDPSDLHPVRDGLVAVAFLSGAATIGMLAGVWRISRAPADSGGSGPAMAALAFMVMGFVLDLVTTSIIVDALGGSVSAAFFAMDALPLLAAGSAVLGVGAGVALLRSFGNMAAALANDELTHRARSAAWLLLVTGGFAGLAMLGLPHLPTELLALAALVLLPLAVASLVQFLRVAVPLSREIRTRLGVTT
jgi:hypothetical protein